VLTRVLVLVGALVEFALAFEFVVSPPQAAVSARARAQTPTVSFVRTSSFLLKISRFSVKLPATDVPLLDNQND
jgi:hypothetical protein